MKKDGGELCYLRSEFAGLRSVYVTGDPDNVFAGGWLRLSDADQLEKGTPLPRKRAEVLAHLAERYRIMGVEIVSAAGVA